MPIININLSKKAENRRKQAAANEYSRKYPLLNDCDSMQASIDNALAELKTIDSTPANTTASKRVKKRNSDTLRSWMLVMKEHLADLTCGINVASTQPSEAAPVSVPEEKQPVTTSPSSPIGTTLQQQEDRIEADKNLAANTKKKGVNWFVIGGIAVAGFVIYKLMKKK